MTAKQDAGKALRSYRDEVRERIKQAEKQIEDLRSEETRVERMIALYAGTAEAGNGAAPAAAPSPTPTRRRRRRRAQSANGRKTTQASGAAPTTPAATTSAAKTSTRNSSTRVPRERRIEQVKAALSSGPLGTRALAQKVGITTSAARDLAHDLRTQGIIETHRDGQGQTAPEVHSLASPSPASSSVTVKTPAKSSSKTSSAKKSSAKKSSSRKRGAAKKTAA